MYLTALLQRERLFDVAARWLSGQLEPGDVRFVSEVFLLEHAITNQATVEFLRAVSAPLRTGPIRLKRLRTKDQVRQTIIESRSNPSKRAADLFLSWRNRAEDFFPGMPVDITVASGGKDGFLAMVRLKRLMRIADKATRKLVAYLERESGKLEISRKALRIDDVVGAKLVVDKWHRELIELVIAANPNVQSVVRREHHGAYNDVKLIITLRAPETGPTIDRLLRMDWCGASQRGISPATLLQSIPHYVESGADSYVVELILTDWDELVESEFGRALHEEHIVRQRTDPRYATQLATNAELTFIYLLTVAVSPASEITSLPVSISGRHLPDAVYGSVASLFGLELDQSPLWHEEIALATKANEP
ncbi:MAG: hypothetical protein V2I48_14585 [Xanthomonadales bacterium]|jgi:hypothetical protein|nr:hypothetical protein [Xanthomonadales bacterium]